MPAIHRILVAVKDTSARSLPAVHKAAQLARGLGAQLQLFHAISTPVYVDAIVLAGQSLDEVQAKWRKAHLVRLERVAERLRAGGLTVTTSCEWDFPAFESILRRALRYKADLIVAERHAQKHLAPWLLRFNDWELLRRSPIPVLLVKTGKPYAKPVVLAAIDPGHSFAKPAKLDAGILALGGTFATALRGTLHAVHAFTPMPVEVSQIEVNLPNLSARIEAQAAAAAQVRFAHALKGTGLPRGRRHLIGRHAADAIPQLARKLRAGIVVMGAISRSGIKRLLIGNTAERALDALACDVLVVKPARFISRVPRKVRGVQFIATPTSL